MFSERYVRLISVYIPKIHKDEKTTLKSYNTTNVKNMYLHRDSNPGPWNTVPML